MAVLNTSKTHRGTWSFLVTIVLYRLQTVYAATSTEIGSLLAGTDILKIILEAVPLVGLVGSSRAREKWNKSCASGSGDLLLPMASYSDCRVLLKPLTGEPHVAAHVNMGSIFDVFQKAVVASILQEVRGMAAIGVVEDGAPHGRRQKLYIAKVKYQEVNPVGRLITAIQALAMIAIGIVGSKEAPLRSVIYLWTYILAAFVTTCAAISCYPTVSQAVTKRARTRAYVVTPNWNSDELFMLIGDGDELAAVLNRPAEQDRTGKIATVAVSIFGFLVTVSSALLLGKPDPWTSFTILLLIGVGWFDWCPERHRRRWCSNAIVHTLDRRRTAYTSIQVLNGKSEQPGWWKMAFPDTPRNNSWVEAVEAARQGVMTPATTIDDYQDLLAARAVIRDTLEANISPVMSDALAGLGYFLKAS